MAMVSKKHSYPRVRFPASLVLEAYERWARKVSTEEPRLLEAEAIFDDHETYTFENMASWLDAYRRNPVASTLMNSTVRGKSQFNYYLDPAHGSTVKVTLPDVDDVNEVIAIFERAAPKSVLPDVLEKQSFEKEVSFEDIERVIEPHFSSRPRVFVGYGGRNQAWRDLCDFLIRLGIEVETFQSETRVGQTITDVLRGMLDRTNFAFLVHSGEDDVGNGRMRARQNIVHETGLFQGRLGFDRAIIIREDGTEDFSNVHGLQEIRFPPGQIRTAFGDVVEILRKHFPEA